MLHRRLYERVKTNATSVIMCKNTGDINCKLVNISENGAAFVVDSIGDNIHVGDAIKFEGFEEYQYLSDTKTGFLGGECEVVRLDTKNNLIGCKILRATQLTLDFITDRKVSDYINSMRHMRITGAVC